MAELRHAGAVLLAAGATMALWSFGDRDATQEHRLDAGITTVVLESSNADITLKVGDGDTTTVQEQREYWFWKRGDTFEVKGDELRLDGDCGWQCSADLVVTLPRGTKVTGDNASGDLTVTGLGGVDLSSRSGDLHLSEVAGDVNLDVTSGDVTIDRLTGKLDLDATSGDVDATRLRGGPVDLKTSSGDLRVELDEANDISVQGSSGDITVVAADGTYKVDATSRSGDVKNGITDDPNGSHRISAGTSSGDVTLATR